MRADQTPNSTTDERVRAAALELFAAKGFAAAGIREIADRAGLSSASLYHYMGTKDDLLASMMRKGMRDVLAGAQQIERRIERPEERVAGLVQFHIQMHTIRQLETRVLDIELRALDAERRDEIVRLRDLYDQIWSRAIEQGLREGVFHDIDPHDARLALVEMCTGVGMWYSPNGTRSPEELGQSFGDMALALLDARRQGQRIRMSWLTSLDPAWLRQLALGSEPTSADADPAKARPGTLTRLR